MTRTNGVPKLCRHKHKGRAVVRLNRKDHYCGPWGPDPDHPSKEALAKYHRLISEWLAADQTVEVLIGQQPGSIAELCVLYLAHATKLYRKNGRPTKEVSSSRCVVRTMIGLYAELPPEEFDTLKLMACRQPMIDAGNARKTVNDKITLIKRIFKWGGKFQLIDPLIYQRLLCVDGLRVGQGGRETADRQPVPWGHVEAVLPLVGRQVRSMILLQWHTGMRSGSVCIMRTADIDTSGEIWFYQPTDHKMATQGIVKRKLLIALGPQAQEVLAPWLRTDPEAYLFQPTEAVAEWQAARRAARKTKLFPSHLARYAARRRRRSRRKPGAAYTPESYRRAIVRACKAGGVPSWTPHQLRHSFATRAGDVFDGQLDKVAAALGHKNVDVTLLYAHLNRKKAAAVARRIG